MGAGDALLQVSGWPVRQPRPGWEVGTFIITADKWYRLGRPEDRRLPGGLRHFYPLAEIRDLEVLRKGIRYDLPVNPARPDVRQEL